MAKIHTYGSMRTAPTEYLPTESTALVAGDLAVLTSGKIVAITTNEPTYLVVGKVANGVVPVTAILDDMVLESADAIPGFEALGNDRYRKQLINTINDLSDAVDELGKEN